MKKVLLAIVPVAAIVAMATTISSCSSEECCTLLTAKICESDLPSTFTNWADYKASLETAGYNCD